MKGEAEGRGAAPRDEHDRQHCLGQARAAQREADFVRRQRMQMTAVALWRGGYQAAAAR